MGCGLSPSETISEDDIRRVLHSTPSLVGQPASESGIEFPADVVFREAAVLIPLACLEGSWHLVYTVRTDLVQDHKGQVAFPGGAVEPEDADRAAAAKREAWEEIGLQPADVRILGYLDDLPTVSGFMITPVVGVIPWPYAFIVSPNEVKRVFTIPLDWLADSSHWEERSFLGASSHLHRKAIFFEAYQGEVLWGITARMTVIFLEILQHGTATNRTK